MMNDQTRSRVRLLLALLLLFFARWLFDTLTYIADPADPVFYLELGYCLVFYMLCVFCRSPLVPFLWTALVGAALSVCFLSTQYDNELRHLLPIVCCPAFLFPLSQFSLVEKKGKGALSGVLTFLVFASPFVLPGILVFLSAKIGQYRDSYFSSNSISFAFFMLLLAALYLLIAFLPLEKGFAAEKKTQSRLRFNYVFAVLAMLEVIFIRPYYYSSSLLRLFPFLWLIDLVFLYERQDQLVCSFVARMKKRLERFLRSDSP